MPSRPSGGFLVAPRELGDHQGEVIDQPTIQSSQ